MKGVHWPVYTFWERGWGMRMQRTPLLLAAAAFAVLALTGCVGDGGQDAQGGTSDLPEQNGLEVGTTAPDFRLKNQDQETVALSDFEGERNVILVFYPADFTPV